MIKLTSRIYYDSIEVIYYLEGKDSFKYPKAFSMVLDCYEDGDIETYQDLINAIQSQERNKKIHSMLIIAELGLDGIVLRWNKEEGLFQVGTTRGYA